MRWLTGSGDHMGLADALILVRAGRYIEALRDLEAGRAPTSERIATDVLRASLLERVEQYSRSRVLAERLLRMQGLSPVHRCDCRFALGLIDWDEGQFD